MDARSRLAIATILTLSLGAVFAKPQKTFAESEVIKIDGTLKKRVEFWKKIYTEYSTNQGLIHDAIYPEIVFEIIDLEAAPHDFLKPSKTRKRLSDKKIEAIKNFYKKTLLSVHQKQKSLEKLNAIEKRVYDLYSDIDERDKFFNAAHSKRIRLQLGQKDRFVQGLFYSGRYLSMMERIFKDRGVPIEITRLPFVESSFNLKARSKVGASGIWQFMRSTGKLYLTINDTVDERNDPIRATEAAASLLKQNFETLGSWPLAITAYNHGRKGLVRAVNKVGSDKLNDIIENYRSRSFGFASSNFYAEFVAAYEVEKEAKKHFADLKRDSPVQFSEFILSDYVSLRELSTFAKVQPDTLVELNPGLSDSVFKMKRLIPSGYVLRIPVDSKQSFLDGYSKIPMHLKFASQNSAVRFPAFAQEKHRKKKTKLSVDQSDRNL